MSVIIVGVTVGQNNVVGGITDLHLQLSYTAFSDKQQAGDQQNEYIGW